ncbi:DoxX family protein [Nocardioides sp. cx-173]|uniref:DoxX family protein n=1 Tax=Nocardioides sp. cx-173 TaxID=2898796 RepID=UPI001E5C20DF|nr:DoxX family protein [Nocardioides sp. cx-173]MCD4524216.1 DoxX family protein [Nocardioides sp. cx-173]UGB41608.1 DoxX family protein [Nocardioides sp. cx-173]
MPSIRTSGLTPAPSLDDGKQPLTMNNYWDDPNFLDYYDAGLMILRTALGAMLVYHGVNKARSWSGTAEWFSNLGLHPGWLHARLAVVTEIGCALLLIAGFLTPLACAGWVALMTSAAITDHRGKGFFVFKGGWEYVGILGVVAAVIALIGPGSWSIDGALEWSLYGWSWFGVAIVLGVVAGVGLVLGSKRIFPAEPAGATRSTGDSA